MNFNNIFDWIELSWTKIYKKNCANWSDAIPNVKESIITRWKYSVVTNLYEFLCAIKKECVFWGWILHDASGLKINQANKLNCEPYLRWIFSVCFSSQLRPNLIWYIVFLCSYALKRRRALTLSTIISDNFGFSFSICALFWWFVNHFRKFLRADENQKYIGIENWIQK